MPARRRKAQTPRPTAVTRYIVGCREPDKVTPRLWTWLATDRPALAVRFTGIRANASRFETKAQAEAAAQAATDIVTPTIRPGRHVPKFQVRIVRDPLPVA